MISRGTVLAMPYTAMASKAHRPSLVAFRWIGCTIVVCTVCATWSTAACVRPEIPVAARSNVLDIRSRTWDVSRSGDMAATRDRAASASLWAILWDDWATEVESRVTTPLVPPTTAAPVCRATRAAPREALVAASLAQLCSRSAHVHVVVVGDEDGDDAVDDVDDADDDDDFLAC
jgi:hypothetical protein